MARIPESIPATDLRRRAASILNRVRKSAEPVFITQRGRPTAVLLSIDTFRRADYERQLLHALARGDQEISAGPGHGLDRVLEDADRMLDADRK